MRAPRSFRSLHTFFRRSVVTVNLIAFILDLYASSNRIDPNIMKYRSLVRTLLKPRVWTRSQIATLLADEIWSNWFSAEQKTQLSNLFIRAPEIGDELVPMAWSMHEALATQWKTTFEPLKLWAPLKEGDTIYWVPMVWPSYLAAFRWQLLMSTRNQVGPTITLLPNTVGFPVTALLEATIQLGALTFTTNIHFLLPDEDVLR